jgi:hypothetical protein
LRHPAAGCRLQTRIVGMAYNLAQKEVGALVARFESRCHTAAQPSHCSKRMIGVGEGVLGTLEYGVSLDDLQRHPARAGAAVFRSGSDRRA